MLVFVYGTLTDPDRARTVLDRDPEYRDDAVLEGLHRADGAYPTLLPDGECEGRLLRVHGSDVHRLDAYEGVDRGLYVRVPLPLVEADDADGNADEGGPGHRRGTVETYVGDPGRLDVDGSWPGDGPLADRVREYATRESVVVRPGGSGTGDGSG